MGEALKTARILHQLVILFSAALMTFALSARKPSSDYVRASSELHTLRVTLPTIRLLRYEEVTDFYRAAGVVDVLAYAFKLSDRSKLRVIPSTGHQGELGLHDDSTEMPLELVRSNLQDIMVTEQALCHKIDLDSLRARLAVGTPYSLPFQEVIPRAGGPLDGGSMDLVLGPWSSSPMIADGVHYSGSVYVPLTMCKNYLLRERLVIPSPGGYEALPALRNVWEVVGSLRIGAAEVALRRKQQELEQTTETEMDLFGFKLKARVAVIAGPAALILLLLYMLAHILQIQSLDDFPVTAIGDAAWIALFDNRIARWLTVATLVLLPAAATIYVVVVSDLSMMAKYIIGGAWASATSLVGAVITYRVWQFKAELQETA